MPNNLAPITLFVYNRLGLARRTIESLQKNYLAADSKLFIFSDGPKNELDLVKVNNVRRYLKTVNGFQSVEIIEKEKNIGLADSIISGVTNIINKFGKIIVLEDDLVTSPFFLLYMNDGLIFYEKEEQVISIHGYVYPLKAGLPETFLIKGADCWGWATWKRGWDIFEPNGQKLLKELKNRRLNKRFNFDNSYNYTKMLEKQISGQNNSWAIRWYASAFLKNKLTLYPSKTLVQNIGLTSGTHCNKMSNSPDCYNSDLTEKQVLIKKIPVEENIKAFRAIKKYFLSLKPNLLEKMYAKAKKVANKNIRSLIKDITPPIILRLYKNKRQKYGFFGNYANWSEARKLTTGYDSDLIVEKVKNAALKVKNGKVSYERDSVLFDQIDYSWPLLSSLLWIAGQNNNQLHLIDFGGALGTSYYQNLKFLKHLNQLSWNIVEQNKIVSYGKKLFANENLHFYESIDDCQQIKNSKAIILSSVLQYLEDPYEFLRQLKKFTYIIIDRMPLFENKDRIVIQKVPPKIYDASYPCWILNRKKFVDFIENELGFELIASFDSHIGTIIDLGDSQAYYKGYLFKKNE